MYSFYAIPPFEKLYYDVGMLKLFIYETIAAFKILTRAVCFTNGTNFTENYYTFTTLV